MEGKEGIETESGAPETESTVEIHSASYEDLEAFLSKEEVGDETDETEQPDEEIEEGEEEASSEAPPAAPEEKKEQSTEPVKPPSQETERQSLDAAMAEVQRLRTLLQQKELFAQRQSTALGEARKQLRERQEKLTQQIKDTLLDDPLSALKAKDELTQVGDQLTALDNEEATIARVRASAEVVKRYVPQEYWDVDAMAQELASDGIGKDYIEGFVKNPLANAMPETLVHLAKRAAAMKHLREVVQVAKNFKTENDNLKKELERLKSGGHIKTLKKAMSATPTMTAASQPSRELSEANIASLDLSKMSKAELEQLLEN